MEKARQIAFEKWLSCPECEAPCRDRRLPHGAELRCRQCGGRVKIARGTHSLQPALAFSAAGLFLWILANVEPVLTFDVAGDVQTNHIVTGVAELVAQGYWPVAALVCFAGIAAPALHLGAVCYVSAACCLRAKWPHLRKVARFVEVVGPWNLVPVYMVATIVAVVKLKMLGTVYWQQGALWILALSLCSLLAAQTFDQELVAERLGE